MLHKRRWQLTEVATPEEEIAQAALREADRYAQRAFEADYECRYGHYGCAVRPRGVCSDEMLSVARELALDAGLDID